MQPPPGVRALQPGPYAYSIRAKHARWLLLSHSLCLLHPLCRPAAPRVVSKARFVTRAAADTESNTVPLAVAVALPVAAVAASAAALNAGVISAAGIESAATAALPHTHMHAAVPTARQPKPRTRC